MGKNTQPLPELNADEWAHINSIIDDAKQQLTRMDEIDARVKQLQEEARAIRESVSGAIAARIRQTPVGTALATASVIYWTLDNPAVRNGLCDGLGIGRNAISWKVHPMPMRTTCDDCGERFVVMGESWSQLNNYRQSCPACTAKREAEDEARRERWARQAEEERAAVRALRTMPYAEYLKTEHWQEVRKAAIKRAKFRCQTCNAAKPLQVHHRTYERRGEELATDVIALCADCHKTFHENGKLVRGES